MTCKKCNQEIEKYCNFPGQLCKDCYKQKMDKIPLEKLSMPDFKKTIKI